MAKVEEYMFREDLECPLTLVSSAHSRSSIEGNHYQHARHQRTQQQPWWSDPKNYILRTMS